MINAGEEFVRVELHMHTSASPDSLVPIRKLLAHCQQFGVDRIAITDHNVINGAQEAKSLDPERVIVGEEIATTQGELLGYFMTDWVPPNLEPLEAIERLRSQDALISVAHPFDTTRRHHWDESSLAEIAPHLDAIETFNARCLSNMPNEQAEQFARDFKMLETVGSDAHSLWEVGRATLMMPKFQDAGTFKSALRHAEKTTKLSPPFVHLFSRLAIWSKRIEVLYRE